MPTITPTDQDTALRLGRAIDTASLVPPQSDIRLQTPNGGNVFVVSQELFDAYEDDVANNAEPPAAANCRGNNPCWQAMCGDTEVPATGATAGIPGTWSPADSTPPATVADLAAGTPNAVVATPNTAWTTGQYVQTATAGAAGQATWTGTAWVGGVAP